MSRNLKVVQTTSRVLEIICKVLFILCMVGAIGAMVGVVFLSIANLFPKLVEKIQDESGRKVVQLIGDCLVGVVVSIEGILVSKAHKDYFAMEQKDGTPFTFEGAKAFRTLGIMNMVAPLIAMVVAAIISAIFNCWSDIRLDVSFGLGLSMILLSFVFAYGAEIEQGKEDCCKEECHKDECRHHDEGHEGCCRRHEGEHHCCCREEAEEATEAVEEAEAAPETPAIEEK